MREVTTIKPWEVAKYKLDFEEFVNGLRTPTIADITQRCVYVDEIITGYLIVTGELPPHKLIERLTNHLLWEDLTDTDPYKASRVDYPFYSERQFERRAKREVSLNVADMYDNDKVMRTDGSRRKRSVRENIFMDVNTKIKNKARKKQYTLDTKASEVISYYVNQLEPALI